MIIFSFQKGLNQKIIHGNIQNCFLSYFVGEIFPIKEVMILSQSIKYKNPVYENETLSFEAKVINYVESMKVFEFNFKFKNSNQHCFTRIINDKNNLMKILITGGSSGLGKSIIESISSSHEIHFTYNNSIKSANEITNRFRNLYSYKCDFTNEIELKDFLIKVKHIDFDILINNYYSGNFCQTLLKKTDSKDFLVVYQNNIIPVIEITKVLLKTFKKKRKD